MTLTIWRVKESSSVFYHLFPILSMYGVYSNEIKDSLTQLSYLGKDTLKGMNVLSTEKPPSSADMRFLEASHQGMNFAGIIQDKNMQLLQYALSIVLLDPEKIAAHAQSGAAMKALFRPVVQFIKQKRPMLKHGICELLQKLETASNKLGARYKLNPGTIENSQKKWGNIFTDTVVDIQAQGGLHFSA